MCISVLQLVRNNGIAVFAMIAAFTGIAVFASIEALAGIAVMACLRRLIVDNVDSSNWRGKQAQHSGEVDGKRCIAAQPHQWYVYSYMSDIRVVHNPEMHVRFYGLD